MRIERHLAAGMLGLALVILACCLHTLFPAAPSPADDALEPAAWWHHAVFYEVFVRSFYDSDGDGIGDLAGLTQKLNYLNDGDPATTDDLGVTALWLMPVMESPTYHGYDVVDYGQVESDYGDQAAFQAFITQAHRRGMRVIIDLPLNHTADDHAWFVEASTGPEAAYRDWYIWRQEAPDSTTGPWGQRVWHPSGDGYYYYGLFWEEMPDLNYGNPDVTTRMHQVARFWLAEMDVDGFRLDAVQYLVEVDDQLAGTPQTHAWLADFYRFYKGVKPDALTVGEVWADTRQVAPYVANDEIDLAFEFDLASAIISAIERGDPEWFSYILERVEASYPRYEYATFLTNHDQNRVMSQLAGDVRQARLGATILLTLPGVPFIYYGEEIGMTGQKPDEMIRTPMQWTAEAHAGFTTGRPWQPVNADFEAVNVAAQTETVDSLLSHYRRLIRLRDGSVALRLGDLTALAGTCDGVYGFARRYEEQGVLVLLNFSDQPQMGCGFSLPAGELLPGGYVVRDGLTWGEGNALTVDSGGGFTDYVPWQRLESHTGYVLLLEGPS